ncbi:hypothetical protein [Cellulomonas humilata]|uniref:Oligosaccharide repeat unit polymerase n=1 Tax=Cellulomonas humilata TaxID=144055 RepID=A0ABU0EA22_9CELL|nr:hypothetical protein [Cellulomonas humilata]MDQ0372108.1 hypothetical protein [Cellulomonas humilata]
MSSLALAAFGLLFACAAVLSAHRSQSWLAPAPIWNVCWCVLFIVTSVLGYGFAYPTGAVSALVLLAALYNLPGLLLGSSIERSPDVDRSVGAGALTPPVWLLAATAAVGFIGAVRLGLDLGTSVFALRSIDDLLSLGQQNAIAIFRGEAHFSFLVNLTFAVLQLGGALGGVRIALKPGRSAILAIAAVLAVAFLWSSITTQRSYVLVPIIWFAAGYVASLVWLGKRAMPGRALLASAILGSGALLLVVFLRAVRTNGTGAGFSEATLAPTRLWLAGYVPTFAAWLEESEATKPSFDLFHGVNALVQPLFGGSVSDGGGESNYYYVGAGMTSNAGTAMMTVIGTGGLVWGALVIVLLGTLAHLVYRRAARGGPVAAAAYIGVVAASMWSTNAWFLGYGGRVLALALVVGLATAALRLAEREERRVARRASANARRARALLRA